MEEAIAMKTLRNSFTVSLVLVFLTACGGDGRSETSGAMAGTAGADWAPPYRADSPWNLPIGPGPVYDRDSNSYVANLSGYFGNDPTRYTYPVYDNITSETMIRRIHVTGVFSNVTGEGDQLTILRDAVVEVPVPAGAMPSPGRDSQIIFIDPVTGDEWGFWRFEETLDSGLIAQNGYHYNINWSGVAPSGFISRGAGLPYYAGLVRPAEIEAGRITHALAFGMQDPSTLFVFPATKSDGKGVFPALPEGARLQLDPSLTDRDFERWGLDETGKIMARALQEYGMILVDYSGHPKIYVEAEHTANWPTLTASTVSPIPYSAFRVLALDAPVKPQAPAELSASLDANGLVTLQWLTVPGCTRYQVSRRLADLAAESETMLSSWVTGSQYIDETAMPDATYDYLVRSVNHNGISAAATVRITISASIIADPVEPPTDPVVETPPEKVRAPKRKNVK